MGKQRPLTDEQETLRQLTRELHEAAQDARDAARELRAAKAAVEAEIGSQFETIMKNAYNAVQKHVDNNIALINQDIGSLRADISQSFAEFMGATTPEQLTDLIIEQTCAVLREKFARVAERKPALVKQAGVLMTIRDMLDHPDVQQSDIISDLT